MNAGAVVHASEPLRVLVIDDEAPAREELLFLLRDDPRVGKVSQAANAGQALRILGDGAVDAVFCDIKMPGLDGVELARVVGRFATPPRIVFVTAYDDRAVDAFELGAVDYLLKPVRADRLDEAVRRVAGAGADLAADDDEMIAVELGGVTRFVRRSQVRFVEAQGDYARLHTADGSHLLRATLSELESRWSDSGFVRIHRSTLVALAHVEEVRAVDGHYTVRVGDTDLQVSRRHSRQLRERLTRR